MTLKEKPLENFAKNFDQQDHEEKLTPTIHEAPFPVKPLETWKNYIFY